MERNLLIPTVMILLLLAPLQGCVLWGERASIELTANVVPGRVSLDAPEPLRIELRVTNVGNATEVIDADAITTEGLEVMKPARTTFTLKPEESRIIIFTVRVTEEATPGDYIVELPVETERGETITERAKVTIVEKKGLLPF
jgi:uncharacterized membrane protein